jgi:RNA polymerase sigma factor (sigma-70 family)
VTVDEHEELAARFEANRRHLRAVAYRMLGSASEADDAVQDAWLKLSRSGVEGVQNFGGWLTTIVARVCLDTLRARRSRPQRRTDPDLGEVPEPTSSPDHETLLADSVGVALLVVLETLAPNERLAFVLHDMFDLPFEEIASIVGCSSAAARQLASRARRRVRGAAPLTDEAVKSQREVVDAFLAASRGGDVTRLLSLLAPDVVLRADRVAVAASAANQTHGAPKLSAELRGAAAVVDAFSGRARAARAAIVDGSAGAVWAPNGEPRAVFIFAIDEGKIVTLDVVVDPEQLHRLEVEILRD